MRINEDEENLKNDFFDGPDIPEPVKKPKEPTLQPDDPRYWDREESEFEHLKPRRKWILWLWVAGAGIALGLILTVYLRYFSPCVEEAVQYGYVEKIDRQGMVFKTYEGVILPYKELMDTTRVYKQDFSFSVTDAKVAAQLRRMQFANLPVRVIYKKYYGTLPWRGSEKILVERVDSVDPRKILPPEYLPEIVKGE